MSLLPKESYRHPNGLKHINVINNDGFSALFVVNTPLYDNTGVAHGVEHMVFRRSRAFSQPETLFQLTSLTDAKINASTLANTTYFHCQSQCHHTFMLTLNYLLNGLFDPMFEANDLPYEIHDGKNSGVIYRELIGAEQASIKKTKDNKDNNFYYGGLSESIGQLSLKDLTNFHQRFYQASNITLVTANADIEDIAHLISLLPKQQSNQLKENRKSGITNTQHSKTSEPHQNKHSHVINKLISVYQLWLQDANNQKTIDDKRTKNKKKPLMTALNTLPIMSTDTLIPALACLSTKLIKESMNDSATNRAIKQLSNKTLLPNLFIKLCQQVKNQLKPKKNQSHASDQRNILSLTTICVSEQQLANITSYIISAYPKFLAPRCQGLCYATQALTIENSAYLAIYSAFDVSPETRLNTFHLSLIQLSQDNHFISMSLDLAKNKYCRAYPVNKDKLKNITPKAISLYLKILANSFQHKG